MSCVLDIVCFLFVQSLFKLIYKQHLDNVCVCLQIVHLTGEDNEDEILKSLTELDNQLKRKPKKKHLISTTVCVSQDTMIPNSVRHYGVSMSTSGGVSGQIMVAASCFSTWDSRVADAVMTFYPDKVRKPYFDGTIRLPDRIRCQAFRIRDGAEMAACNSCAELFGLLRPETAKKWAHGNCSEVESVSNLLKNETSIKEQVQLTSEVITDENRQRARGSVLRRLEGLLNDVTFKWDYNFYPNIRFDPKNIELETFENKKVTFCWLW